MLERERIYKALTHIAWGYVFLYFDFKLDTLSLTPSFVGYLLFFSTLPDLAILRRDLALLRPLGLFLAIVQGIDWLLTGPGYSILQHILFLNLLNTAAGLYFHFQLLTDLAAIAAAYQGPEGTIDHSLLRCRTIQTIYLTLAALLSALITAGILPLPSSTGPYRIVWILLLVPGLVVTLLLVLRVFALRKLFQPETPAEGAETAEAPTTPS